MKRIQVRNTEKSVEKVDARGKRQMSKAYKRYI